MYCSQCGAEVGANSNFCSNCGARIDNAYFDYDQIEAGSPINRTKHVSMYNDERVSDNVGQRRQKKEKSHVGYIIGVVVVLVTVILYAFSFRGVTLDFYRKKPKAEDAEKYVKAALDYLSTGDYDHSVVFADLEANSNFLDDAFDEVLKVVIGEYNLETDVKDGLKDYFRACFSKAKYQVGDAIPAESGYIVPVTITPIVFNTTFEDAVDKGIDIINADPNVGSMSEDAYVNAVLRFAIICLKGSLNDVKYGQNVVVNVNYKELSDGYYGIDRIDGEKLGAAMSGRNS